MNLFSSLLPKWLRRVFWMLGAIAVVGMIAGTIRNSNFWSTPEQKGDALFHAGKFKEAAHTYTDPLRIGVAQYRDGNFEVAAQTFTRVPGAAGFYNQGNAWLLRGKYDLAIADYDKALVAQPGWKEAGENKAIAQLRKSRLEHAADGAAEAPQDKADEVVFDKKGENGKTADMAEGSQQSDEATRALWLRRVQTTPRDFLRAKFAFQQSQQDQSASSEDKRQ